MHSEPTQDPKFHSDGPEDAALSENVSDSEFIATEQKPNSNRTALILVGLLLIGGGGMYLMNQRTGPQPAGAAEQATQAQQTIDQFLNQSDENLQRMEALLRDTEQIVQQFHTYPTLNQIPLSALRTNPFRHELKERKPEVDTEEIERQRREEQRLAVLQAVQQLHLQSIVYGSARKACMINNTLYREGDTVKEFTIETIQQQSVIVRNGPWRFELTMRR